jgi:CBS domain containing-hemolysin-like protein
MPSTFDDRQIRLALLVLSVLVVLYSLIIVQQILLGFLIIVALWLVYLFYHLVGILARIATALEDLARQRTDGGGDACGEDATETGDREPENHD